MAHSDIPCLAHNGEGRGRPTALIAGLLGAARPRSKVGAESRICGLAPLTAAGAKEPLVDGPLCVSQVYDTTRETPDRNVLMSDAKDGQVRSANACGPHASFPCTLQERIKKSSREFQGGQSMIICDLCGEAKDCLQKEMEGKEYDICSECWNPLAEKLRGKGRAKNRETVFLPPPRIIKEREDEEPEPLPGGPPKIWGAMERPH